MTTYANGFRIKYTQDVSRKQFIEICNRLGCTIDFIYGGGFLFIHESRPRAYKTMWLNIPACAIMCMSVMDDWKEDTSILVPTGTETSTFLKAGGAAPPWTFDDLAAVQGLLEEYGCVISDMPAEESLVRGRRGRRF